MAFAFKPAKYLTKLLFPGAVLGLVVGFSLLQGNILKVDAALQVLLVSDTAIPFGTVFPGDQLSKTYTVKIDTSSQNATYSTQLSPVLGKENLCPFLDVTSIDLPAETDSLASSSLASVTDGIDNWQVKLNTPGIIGQIAQTHDGGIVVRGGDYECKITITAKTVEAFGEGFIQGVKFNDLNGDGVKNNGETALAGWQIYIDQNNNGLPDAGEKITTTATTTGFYTFEFLPVGTYTVREVLKNSWQQTLPGAGAGFKYDVFVDNFTADNINFGNRFVEGLGGCSDEECAPGGGSPLTGSGISGTTSSGGSGGGSGGGGGSLVQPQGEVAGATLDNPWDLGGLQTFPSPDVLGAATELPRTGIPGVAFFALAALSYGLARRLRQAK